MVLSKPHRPKPEPKPDKPLPVVTLDMPTGKIQTAMPWGKIDLDWREITQWWEIIKSAAKEFDVPYERITAHIVIESQGDETAIQRNNSNGWSYGLMQVVPRWWKFRIEELANKRSPTEDAAGQAMINSPQLAVRVGTSILSDLHDQSDSWDEASSEFFLGNPNWIGADTVNGNTGKAYQKSLNGLIAELGGDQPKPEPKPVDPIAVIVGNRPYSTEYHFGDDVGLDYYGYGVGHGLQRSTQHTGEDILIPFGTPLYAPLAGEVRCVGTTGRVTYGQGCGAFTDTGNYPPGGTILGIGKISILTDSGLAITFGHCRTATVKVGDRVQPGRQVGTSGGQNGPHCHLETAIERNGTYWLIAPIAALREAMGGVVPVVYAEGLPIMQPDDLPPLVTMKALRATPVLQRGYDNSEPVRAPLKEGETIQTQHMVYGDGWYVVDVKTLGRIAREDLEQTGVTT